MELRITMNNLFWKLFLQEKLCDRYPYVVVHDIWTPFRDPPLIVTISYWEGDPLLLDDVCFYPDTIEWNCLLESAQYRPLDDLEAVALMVWMEEMGQGSRA